MINFTNTQEIGSLPNIVSPGLKGSSKCIDAGTGAQSIWVSDAPKFDNVIIEMNLRIFRPTTADAADQTIALGLGVDKKTSAENAGFKGGVSLRILYPALSTVPSYIRIELFNSSYQYALPVDVSALQDGDDLKLQLIKTINAGTEYLTGRLFSGGDNLLGETSSPWSVEDVEYGGPGFLINNFGTGSLQVDNFTVTAL